MYPFKNHELQDIKGEDWECLPILDGLYRISNFGRVKLLEREMNTGTEKLRRVSPKIIKSYLVIGENKSITDEV